MEEIRILIGEDGKVTMTVRGVAGSRCTELTSHLRDALGVVTEHKTTSEYDQATVVDPIVIKAETKR